MNQFLRPFADNKEMMAAVKLAILDEFSTSMSLDMPNEELGQVVRARLEGTRLVEEAFRKISSMRTPDAPEQEVNMAR